MRRLPIYLDEDAMDGELVRGLRLRGVDVLTAADVRMIRREDEDHLRFASSCARALYSFNIADYYELHTNWSNTGKCHAGIILGQQKRLTVREQIRRLVHLTAVVGADAMKNRIEFLNNW